MKISGPGQIAGAQKSKSANKAGDGSFSKFLDSVEEEKEVMGTAPTSRINTINLIQEVDGDERSKRRKLVDDGEDILDELTKIRDALLFGNISAEQLRGIQAKITRIEANCNDPHLNEIIEQITIRAAVELAKLGF